MKKLIIAAIILIFSTTAYGGQYMKGNADTRPQDTIKCKEKTIVNYNIKEVTITDMDGKSRQAFEYDYVEVDNPLTKAKFKEALGKKDREKKDTTVWTPAAAVLEYESKKVK